MAAVLVIGGLAVGTIAALALTRFLRGLLFGVEPGDPLMLAGNVLVLLVVAFAACLLPTRRALAVDPIRALSAE
jgi:ABC-type antimicrobial peptide transport system permease subunit